MDYFYKIPEHVKEAANMLKDKIDNLKIQAEALQKSIDEYEGFVKKIDKPMWHKGDGYTGYRMQFRFDAQDEPTAEAIFEALNVIFELRQQPGSGQTAEQNSYTWYITPYGRADTVCATNIAFFGISPPFPTRALAEQAVAAVGLERIMKAYRTLVGIK